MAIRAWTLALVAFGAVAAARADSAAQNPPASPRDAPAPGVGAAGLSGVVVDAASSQPLARVRVDLRGQPGTTRATLTDLEGRFQFPSIPAGSYEILATLDPFVPARYGEKKAGRPGTPIPVADRQEIRNLTIRMTRGGAIAGIVVTPGGQPSTGTIVRAMRRRFSELGPRLDMAGSSPVDDRGQYRIFGLAPGDYLVMAQPKSEDLTPRGAPDPGAVQPQLADGYAPSYYPGTPSAGQSAAVSVGAGEDRAGVDIVMPLVPLARVRGFVTGPSGQILNAGRVTLMRDEDVMMAGAVPPAAYITSGRFSFGGLAPGQYTLALLSTTGPAGPGDPPPGSMLYGVSHLGINGRDVTDLAVTLQPGVTVSGRAVFAGARPPANLTSFQIFLTSVGGGFGQYDRELHGTHLDAQSRFAIPDVPPGSFSFWSLYMGPDGWSLQSVMHEGRNVLDTAFEVGSESLSDLVVTLTDHPSEISGTIRDAAGQPVVDCTVVVFAADKQLWFPGGRGIGSVRPAADGRFRLPNLPAGDLLLAAVDDVEPGEWYNPQYLERLAVVATHVPLGPGDRKTADLRVVQLPK